MDERINKDQNEVNWIKCKDWDGFITKLRDKNEKIQVHGWKIHRGQ